MGFVKTLFQVIAVSYKWLAPWVNKTESQKAGSKVGWLAIIVAILGALQAAAPYIQPLLDSSEVTPDAVEAQPGDVPAVDSDVYEPVGFIHEMRQTAIRAAFVPLKLAAMALPVGCAAPLNSTQKTYATIGLNTVSCAATCGISYGADAIEGTATGEAALACLTNCAAAQGLKVIAQLIKDVATGATGGGWFGSAETTNTHTPVYKVMLVREK